MTKSTYIENNWAGDPLYIIIFVHPNLFPQPTESVEKREKTEEVKGVLGIIETYTKVPTPSGPIDKTVEIVKITSYLLFFSILI